MQNNNDFSKDSKIQNLSFYPQDITLDEKGFVSKASKQQTNQSPPQNNTNFQNQQNQSSQKFNHFQSLFNPNSPLSSMLGSNILSSLFQNSNNPLASLLSGNNLNQNNLIQTLSSIFSQNNKKNSSPENEEGSTIEIDNSFEEM